MGRLEGAGSVEVTCTDRSRDTESALLLSLLPQSRGTVTESVTLHPTVLGWSLPTHSPGVGPNVSPGQRGTGGGLSNAARQLCYWQLPIIKLNNVFQLLAQLLSNN